MGMAWFIIITFVVIAIQIYIYSIWGLSRIRYTRSFNETTVFAGEKIELIDEIANEKLLPIPWLRLESRISDHLQFEANKDSDVGHGGFHRTLFSLMPYQKVKRKQSLTCTKRGYYSIKTASLTTGDVFGFGENFKFVDSPVEVTVYPRLLSMDNIPLPAHSLLGDIIVRRWVIEDPFLTAGVREYSNGDPLNAVNWKSTARTNQLQVTKKDYSADHYLMIYVNFNQTDDVWLPVTDEVLMEKALSYAATIAEFAIEQGISTGFGCNSYVGDKTLDSLRITPENSKQQLMFLFDTMAKLELDANKSIGSFLQEDIDSRVQGIDIVLITAIETEKMNAKKNELEALGNAVETIVLEADAVDS